jgi:hypothetical protein
MLVEVAKVGRVLTEACGCVGVGPAAMIEVAIAVPPTTLTEF